MSSLTPPIGFPLPHTHTLSVTLLCFLLGICIYFIVVVVVSLPREGKDKGDFVDRRVPKVQQRV